MEFNLFWKEGGVYLCFMAFFMLRLLPLVLLFFTGPIISQTLHPQAVKIKTAFEKLSLDTNNRKLQKNFVAAFPSDAQTFLDIFLPEKLDQLYSESYRYLQMLKRCAKTIPKNVIGKCIDIGKDLVWDADAVGHMQKIIVELSMDYLKVFIGKFGTLSTDEQNRLINFYADVENHNAYTIYQDLIDKLNAIGRTDITAKLEVARTDRKNRQGH